MPAAILHTPTPPSLPTTPCSLCSGEMDRLRGEERCLPLITEGVRRVPWGLEELIHSHPFAQLCPRRAAGNVLTHALAGGYYPSMFFNELAKLTTEVRGCGLVIHWAPTTHLSRLRCPILATPTATFLQFVPLFNSAYYIHNFKGSRPGVLFRAYPGECTSAMHTLALQLARPWSAHLL